MVSLIVIPVNAAVRCMYVIWTQNLHLTLLVHKLYNFGIKGKMFRFISGSFQGCTSLVVLNGHLSDAFEIE